MTYEYRIEPVSTSCTINSIENHLNQIAAQGWRFRAIWPTHSHFLFEREKGECVSKPDISHGFHVFRDGEAWCAVGPRFNCLADSLAGFGGTPIHAIDDLRATLLRVRPDFYQRHALPTFEQFKVHR